MSGKLSAPGAAVKFERGPGFGLERAALRATGLGDGARRDRVRARRRARFGDR